MKLSFLETFAHLSSLSLHECKHEYFSFQGHISIIIWTANIFCVIMHIVLIFLLIFTWSAISFDRFSYFDGLYNSVLLKTFDLWIRILRLAWTLIYWIAWGSWLSFVIFIVDHYHSPWDINCMQCRFDTLVKRLINALARTWFWVLNCMSDVWTLRYNTRTHWCPHWTFLYRLCDWISLSLLCMDWLLIWPTQPLVS